MAEGVGRQKGQGVGMGGNVGEGDEGVQEKRLARVVCESVIEMTEFLRELDQTGQRRAEARVEAGGN